MNKINKTNLLYSECPYCHELGVSRFGKLKKMRSKYSLQCKRCNKQVKVHVVNRLFFSQVFIFAPCLIATIVFQSIMIPVTIALLTVLFIQAVSLYNAPLVTVEENKKWKSRFI